MRLAAGRLRRRVGATGRRRRRRLTAAAHSVDEPAARDVKRGVGVSPSPGLDDGRRRPTDGSE